MLAAHAVEEHAGAHEAPSRRFGVHAVLHASAVLRVDEQWAHWERLERLYEPALLLLAGAVGQFGGMEVGERALRRMAGDEISDLMHLIPLHAGAAHAR